MDSQQFVDALRLVVSDAAKSDVPKLLEKPPGRAPAANLREMSAWYLRLSEDDRVMVRRVLAEAVDATMFGLLCVLDGVRALHEPNERGELVLEYVGPQGRTRLNDPQTTSLHELL